MLCLSVLAQDLDRTTVAGYREVEATICTFKIAGLLPPTHIPVPNAQPPSVRLPRSGSKRAMGMHQEFKVRCRTFDFLDCVIRQLP